MLSLGMVPHRESADYKFAMRTIGYLNHSQIVTTLGMGMSVILLTTRPREGQPPATLRTKSLENISNLELPYSQYKITHSLVQRRMGWAVQGGRRWSQVVHPESRPPLKWAYGCFKGRDGLPIGHRNIENGKS
jgi:hypothetical protein